MKKIRSLLFIIIILLSFLSSCKSNAGSGSIDISFNDLHISDDSVLKASANEKLIMLDIISPGLDSFGLRTALFSAESEKLLFEKDFGEGTFFSGLTDSGFWIANESIKSFDIYDSSGSISYSHSFSEYSSIANYLLSPDKSIILFTDAEKAQWCKFYIKESKTEIVSPFKDAVSILGTNDSGFIIRENQSDVKLIPFEKSKPTEIMTEDQRITRFFEDYGFGQTDINFYISDYSKECPISFVSFKNENEDIIGTKQNAFLTKSEESDKIIIRRYDLKNSLIGIYRSSESAENIFFIDPDRIGMLIKGESGYAIKKISNDLFETEKLSIKDSDDPDSDAVYIPKAKLEPKALESYLINTETINQNPSYPTGCESVSSVMALRYAGFDISVDDFIDTYLERERSGETIDGKYYAPNPYEVFFGSPRNETSFGCMAPVIYKALKKAVRAKAYIKDLTGAELEELCNTYIANDIPVITWATINMIESYPSISWYLKDGSKYYWPANEHCLLLVGYDENNYYFNDPYTGKMTGYNKSKVEKRYDELGKQAIAIIK